MREQEGAQFHVPRPRGLLKVVESLLDSTNMRGKVGVNDTWRSRHLNILTNRAMKKGIVNVQPMNGPAMRHNEMQTKMNCCRLDNQTKGNYKEDLVGKAVRHVLMGPDWIYAQFDQEMVEWAGRLLEEGWKLCGQGHN
ncbi:hypothetical protein L3X38_032289 [Prunus dulcis]|uniref:Uncharacterized protein n=1 Tax=Prunus dulcis TaxID=3755 RepID=A0AAD4VFG7_PRUDU|nr:hypothetical protein L3X38_032289 [Prunus dulcis]